ncbi:ABC transporter permease [Nocardioides piscis]|uniref:Transport permease protein n=1 Tax=Nocardioides piscis TaxID=2714938 RepID=A0A6G7YIP1_9ACTN|nr:ABC transporter permease [Nocardioides piscis]QIK76611.1 ABC transporter permease [Nocardioides piscis]
MSHTDQDSRLTSRPALERPEIVPTNLLRQSMSIVRRNLTHIKRMPEMLMDVTIQPVMFVLLFAYVFGSSIDIDTAAGYKAWLLGGIMAQTIAFSSFIVAVGLTADLEKGIVDRMRSLPINPAAVLVGRSISSLMHSSIGLVVMSLTGLVIGWRIHTNIAEAALGYLLLLGWGFAMIWVGIWVGSKMRSVEAVNGVMFATMFPITFLANTFAPTDRMPTWLRTVAEWNPISSLTQAVRELWGNDYPLREDAALPLQHPVLATIIWIIVLTAVVAPLAIRTFNRRTAS